ncbi:hypothetical protein JZU54_06410, partial [bacterium]|nr:hypothetical protein [bacterium]
GALVVVGALVDGLPDGDLVVGPRVVGLDVGTAVGLDVVGPDVGESVVSAIRYSEKTASVTILASHWCEATARPTL